MTIVHCIFCGGDLVAVDQYGEIARRKSDEWQPIETAPKDGLIDIWIANRDGTGRRVSSCYYDRICDEWRTSQPALLLYRVKASCVTHWRPLPSPPSTLTAGE